VLWAETPAEVNALVLEIATRHAVRKIIKSKSMVSEESALDHAIEAAGITVVETDLGEYILQINDYEPPSHIIGPALHKSKEEVADLFHEKHPLGLARFAEDAGRNRGNVVTAVHLAPQLLALFHRPRRQRERQQRDDQHQGQGEAEHRPDPVRQAHAARKPHHHLRIAVAARQGHQDRDEQRQRQQHRQIVYGGEAEQGRHGHRGDGAARGLAEQPHQLGRDRNAE
jgi:hypothetical protein